MIFVLCVFWSLLYLGVRIVFLGYKVTFFFYVLCYVDCCVFICVCVVFVRSGWRIGFFEIISYVFIFCDVIWLWVGNLILFRCWVVETLCARGRVAFYRMGNIVFVSCVARFFGVSVCVSGVEVGRWAGFCFR